MSRVSSVCSSSLASDGFIWRGPVRLTGQMFPPSSNLYTSHYYKHLRSQTMIYCQKTIHETSCHLELKNTSKHVTVVPFVWEWLACSLNETVPVAPTELKDESWCVFCDLYIFCEGWAALILLSEKGNSLKSSCKTAQGLFSASPFLSVLSL